MIDITLNYTLEEQSSLSMKDYIQLYTTMHIKTNTTSPNTDEKSFKVSKQMDKQREYQLIELKDNHRHIINNESSKTGHYWLTTTTQICPPIKPKDRNLRYYLEFIAYILINYLILNLCILVKRNSSPLRINSWQFTQLSDFNMVMGIMNAFLVLFVVLNLMFSMTFGVIGIYSYLS